MSSRGIPMKQVQEWRKELNFAGIVRGLPHSVAATLTESGRQRRRELQCQREEREANREVWE